jgi:hypothetical protein
MSTVNQNEKNNQETWISSSCCDSANAEKEGRQEVRKQRLTGERALFNVQNMDIYDTIFEDGESPLKESRDINLYGSMFRWKYPLWYTKNIYADNCVWFDTARAGVWYTDNITVKNTLVSAPKNFRRCRNLKLLDVTFTDAKETLWHCDGVTLKNVTAKGDYFCLDTDNLEVDNLTLEGNYSFDGTRNMIIRNSRLLSKDAFWNTENVTVYNSFISGEYLGWNAKNLTLIDCTIESLQGMCYIDNLVMKNCKLINTTLAFEYSSCDVTIKGGVDSVINPKEGTIRAEYIDNLIMEKDKVDTDKTKIILGK